MTPSAFQTFADLLKSGSGFALGPDKTYLLETRLAPILRREGLRDLDALAERLRAPGAADLARRVTEAMTTNETSFFRDQRPFEHFRAKALPRLVSSRAPGTKLRIWSAAAASGQEAHSLAMIAADNSALLGNRAVEIVGTDIARDQLARASAGLYTQFEVQRGLPMQMLVRHFRKEPEGWRVAEAIRAVCSFCEWNLLGDLRPLGRFDVVFCRNVLIYFDEETKIRVLEAIVNQLAPDGLLYLGGAETIIGLTGIGLTGIGPAGIGLTGGATLQPLEHGVFRRAEALPAPRAAAAC